VTITVLGAVRSVEWKASDGTGYAGVGILDGDTLVVGWGLAGKARAPSNARSQARPSPAHGRSPVATRWGPRC
jgi:hypothetical protein